MLIVMSISWIPSLCMPRCPLQATRQVLYAVYVRPQTLLIPRYVCTHVPFTLTLILGARKWRRV
jgi:hypothetical protein